MSKTIISQILIYNNGGLKVKQSTMNFGDQDLSADYPLGRTPSVMPRVKTKAKQTRMKVPAMWLAKLTEHPYLAMLRARDHDDD